MGVKGEAGHPSRLVQQPGTPPSPHTQFLILSDATLLLFSYLGQSVLEQDEQLGTSGHGLLIQGQLRLPDS